MSRNFESLTQLESELSDVDHRTRSAVDLPVIKSVPHCIGAGNSGQEMSRLVQSMFLSPNGSNPRSVVFCGVDGESGSSFVCADAGRILAAKSSHSICVVDANARSPRLPDIFGGNTPTATFGKAASVRERCVQVGKNLWLAEAAVLAGSKGELPPDKELTELLAQLGAEFEYLFIDVAGANVCGDALVLGQASDAVILIIEAHSTRRLSARKAKEALDAAGVRLLGVVLHNRSFPIPESLYKRL
jgi:Mrp family chromosome partitioning ATPase